MDKWDHRFVKLAREIASWSSCFAPGRKIGCVIVKDKRIMTTGYNGAPQGMRTCVEKANKEKKGINRYGYFILPMDEVLVLCSLDLCDRPFLGFEYEYKVPIIGELDTELVREFFYAVSYSAGMNLHFKVLSDGNAHHVTEAMFKAFAKALDMATSTDRRIDGVLSTKGAL